ncbi:MAG: carboxypeptidase-like regulatory domain-containing protein, partial [Bacteroidales bacterium]|nr:carboxypeptidase-like regulatory domain-containing protein [Bacteroidales bacterium]
MKNFLITVLLLVGSIISNAQNGLIKAKFVDKDKNAPIVALPVWLNTIKFITNQNGELEATVPYGNYILVVSAEDYETYTQKIELNSSEFDAGMINLAAKVVNQSDLTPVDENSIASDDIDDKSNQNVNGLLHSSSDPFTNAASYNLGAANFRIRGYDASNIAI